MSMENIGCPHCGSVVSFSIEEGEIMSIRELRDGVNLDRFEGLGYSTKHKSCPSCDGKIAVHYSGEDGDDREGEDGSSFPQKAGS